MATRNTLDKELVRRGIAENIDEARELVNSLSVTVSGGVALKPERLVSPGEPIEIRQSRRFVSRGGEKLEAALDQFGVDVTSKHVIDVGASTGGFTDCLLKRGARLVTAVDTGTNQIDQTLRENARVRVHENTNARDVKWSELLDEPAELIVVDVSFVSITALIKNLCSLGIPIVALIKPQFEASKKEADVQKGVIDDPKIWMRVLQEVTTAFADHHFACDALMASPLRGQKGNVEFLGLFTTNSDKTQAETNEIIAKLVRSAFQTRE